MRATRRRHVTVRAERSGYTWVRADDIARLHPFPGVANRLLPEGDNGAEVVVTEIAPEPSEGRKTTYLGLNGDCTTVPDKARTNGPAMIGNEIEAVCSRLIRVDSAAEQAP